MGGPGGLRVRFAPVVWWATDSASWGARWSVRVPRQSGSERYPWPWPKVRKRILERDGYTCVTCGKYADTVDHIVPVSDAPHLMFEPSNLQAMCRTCNSRKELQRREWAKRIDKRPANRRVW